MQCQATATLQDCRLLSHSRGALRSVVKVPSLPTSSHELPLEYSPLAS